MKGIMTGAAAVAGVLGFYGTRTGFFGTNKITVTDDKWRKHHVIEFPGVFYDELSIWNSSRITTMVELELENVDSPVEYPTTYAFGIESKHWSIKPISYEIVKFDRETELISRLISTCEKVNKENENQPLGVRKELVRSALNKVIDNF